MATSLLFQRGDKTRRMRDDDHLRALGPARDKAGERRQEVWVQARLRLVQHQKSGWARREKRRNPKEVAQSSVGELGGAQWPQQAVLLHFDFEPSAILRDRYRSTRERVGHRFFKRLRIADLHDGLHRSGE